MRLRAARVHGAITLAIAAGLAACGHEEYGFGGPGTHDYRPDMPPPRPECEPLVLGGSIPMAARDGGATASIDPRDFTTTPKDRAAALARFGIADDVACDQNASFPAVHGPSYEAALLAISPYTGAATTLRRTECAKGTEKACARLDELVAALSSCRQLNADEKYGRDYCRERAQASDCLQPPTCTNTLTGVLCEGRAADDARCKADALLMVDTLTGRAPNGGRAYVVLATGPVLRVEGIDPRVDPGAEAHRILGDIDSPEKAVLTLALRNEVVACGHAITANDDDETAGADKRARGAVRAAAPRVVAGPSGQTPVIRVEVDHTFHAIRRKGDDDCAPYVEIAMHTDGSLTEAPFPVEGEAKCLADRATAARNRAALEESCRDWVQQFRNAQQPLGRRPAGLVEARISAPPGAEARFFARAAWLEEASIDAFRDLERELAHHGAPAGLLARCRRAAEDERRHAESMASFVRAAGIEVPRVERKVPTARSLFDLALENAREGCAGEAYAAAVAGHQAARAVDPRLREAMATIARDEAEHAALAWDVAAWIAPKLTAGERRDVNALYTDALAAFGESTACDDEPTQRALGLPDGPAARAIAAALLDELGRAA